MELTRMKVLSDVGRARYASTELAVSGAMPRLGRLIIGLAFIAANVDIYRLTGTATTAKGIVEGDLRRALLLGFVYALAAAFAVKAPSVSLRRIAAVPFLLVAIVYAVISIAWSDYPLRGVTACLHLVGYLAVGLCFLRATDGSATALAHSLFWPCAILLVASIGLAIFLPELGVDFQSGHPRWSGVAYHPNSLGIVALVTTWCTVVLVGHNASNKKRFVFGAVLLLAIFCLFKSNSMTSFLLSILLVAFSVSIALLRPLGRGVMLFATIFVPALLVSLLAITTGMGLMSWDEMLGILGRSSTLTGRLDLWSLGLQLYSERPVFGWGFDSLTSVPARFRLNYGQLHNGYIDVLVRGGGVALLLLLGMLLMLARHLLILFRTRDLSALPYAWLAIVCLGHNVTEASLLRAPHPMWLMMTVLMLSVAEIVRRRQAMRASSRPPRNFC